MVEDFIYLQPFCCVQVHLVEIFVLEEASDILRFINILRYVKHIGQVLISVVQEHTLKVIYIIVLD